jgi:hypothetical protein
MPNPAHAMLGTSSILGGAALERCDNDVGLIGVLE